MDALSEKSPNQASQSPHADLPESALKSKTQVPDMMDIEAQLAKMEGLNGGDECCISSALQDSLKQGTVSLSVHSNDSNNSPKEIKSYNEDEISLTPTNVDNSTPIINKEEDLEPLPLRVAPPLYTYSNPEKSRDSEENYGEELENNSGQNTLKNKSLLEALLIEIPADQHHNSDSGSPATRSVRTRASSKLNSPDINLNSPVSKQQRAPTPANKRKRLESDSSNHAVEELRKKN
ncbi:hypothetical protein WA026_002234 [Henosepilachna vigintioctopunctata]|uniref:Uncharacterized protein n=1 Tax=Henosepilachna vigintioctopunctata TaxID=420089 RepID=A0AAW1TZU3_9CUCU